MSDHINDIGIEPLVEPGSVVRAQRSNRCGKDGHGGLRVPVVNVEANANDMTP